MLCKKCNQSFSIRVVIDGKERNLQHRKYCLECSPFGKHNTRKMISEYDGRSKGNIHLDGPRTCKVCGKIITNNRRYRCNTCNVIRYRQNVKRKLVEYKGGKCIICGYNICMRNLVFHHINAEEKEFQITGQSISYDRIKNEVDKCVLLCCRCHGEIHEGLIKIPE